MDSILLIPVMAKNRTCLHVAFYFFISDYFAWGNVQRFADPVDCCCFYRLIVSKFVQQSVIDPVFFIQHILRYVIFLYVFPKSIISYHKLIFIN